MAKEMMQGGTQRYEDGTHRAWLEVSQGVTVKGQFRTSEAEADADLDRMIAAAMDIDNSVQMHRVQPGRVH